MKDEKKTATEIVEMADPRPVELEVPAPEEKPKRGRKKQSAPKKENHAELEQNLAVMVKTVFDLLALRDPIWKLADQEVVAVAKPGARILARLGAAEETTKNADYLLLAVGLMGIMVPRIMLIKARGQVKRNEPERPAESRNREADRTSSRTNADNVKQLLPSLA